MARLPLVSEKTHPELVPLIERICQERGGRLLNLYATLLHSPPVAEGWLKLLTAVRQQTRLDPALRELAILHVALLNRAEYEYQTHVPFALQAGLTLEQLKALPRWRESPLFDPRARDVLAYVEAVTRDVHVPDTLFEPLRRWFDPRQLVELTVTVAAYNMVSRFLEALQVEVDR